MVTNDEVKLFKEKWLLDGLSEVSILEVYSY